MNDDTTSHREDSATTGDHGRAIPTRGDKMKMLETLRASLHPERVKGAITNTASKATAAVDATAAGAHKAIDYVAAKVAPVPEKTRSAINTATVKAKDVSRSAIDTRDEWVHRARSEVRRKPLTAVGIAAAVGLLLVVLSAARRPGPDYRD